MTSQVVATYPVLTMSQEVVFAGELRRWTVNAVSADGRFAVLIWSKPGSETLYTVIDWENGVRGAENLVFGFGCENADDARKMIERLTRQEDPTEVSYRNWVWLRFSDYQPDPRTAVDLPHLVAASRRAYERRPQRQNTFYKVNPWSGLGPLAREAWVSATPTEEQE